MIKLKYKIIFSTFICFLLFPFSACSNEASSDEEIIIEIPVTLTASDSNIDFETEASSFDVTIITTANAWTISNSATNWITLSKTSGLKGSSPIKISVAENSENSIRSATVTIIAKGVTPVKIAVTQKAAVAVGGNLYPSYNNNPIAADAIGMSSTATEIASKIKLGWNLGNTLEAIGSETAWGNPKASKALIVNSNCLSLN